ncbi:pyruvate dehydrogenase E1 component alpha subunit/2-oxoisovalerate dehydrogenase E1 component [Daejeonella rubra]|uniref:Pyruvate dehydrogenase E1 component subunit alpha n=1 Tax=Daejeonella rubra TaxID=990371 RepID=A0A1G9YNJ9_9SPHI|nr:pyruvate dehydrogenase (acetyl-transferring) E1 component subunit alpha [Daejeonella rubra]SDN10165.1 pyruvate dehydrogenase E1 component alpha subunit/2-oxoisovalerate dehydrogenase E1 component [Daejeonella rubra]
MEQTAIKIKTESGLHFLYQMKLIRRFEEKAAEQYTKARIRGFLHLYIGEEAVAVGVIQALSPDDVILSTYREHGHALARGISPSAIMAEMYGKREGCSMGRGGSMHLFDRSKNFYGGNAIVSGHLPMSVGMALAYKKQQKNQISCCFFGEGAAAEGEFHESLNLAALWNVPVLFVCENNLYAMGTAIRYTHSMQELEKKGIAYGIESKAVDGMDLLAVLDAANEATELIRKTGKPYLLVCNTFRFRAHSMFDAELYREKTEVEEWKKRDPIPAFEKYLSDQRLITENDIKVLEARIESEVQQAVDYAEAGTLEPIEELTHFVYSDPSK